MVKKVKKNICIIFFLIIFIFINFSNVFAYETIKKEKIMNYTAGTQMILVKNAYRYVIKDDAEKDPSDRFYFNKGEIVEYTGNHKVKVKYFGLSNDYYIEVKKGEKKGYIHINNLAIYEHTRPESIEEFIKKYGIDKIKTEKELRNKTSEIREEARATGEDIDYYVNQANGNLLDITHMERNTREEYKNKLKNWYKDAKDELKAIDGDYIFLAVAYEYAYKYQTLLNMDETYGKDTGKDNDWAKKFDKAYQEYTKAGDDDNKKNAAMQMMRDAWNKMSKEEKTKEREEQYNKVDKEEKENYEQAQSSSPIYKLPEKISSGNTSEQSLNDMISDGDAFTNQGNIIYNSTVLQGFSKTFYNIMLTVGIFVAVIIGGILGIKFMVSGLEEKADVKKMLIIYLIGCIVVFGGFGIWKIIVDIMQNVWG